MMNWPLCYVLQKEILHIKLLWVSEKMLHVVPPVFQPITLRSKLVYKDVSKRKLSPSEKTFLASEALEKTTMLTWEDTK